jgi:hypothetical protein
MELLPEELKSRLPPIHAQEAEEDPMIFARYWIPGTNLAWYVLEGEADGDDYMLFGFVTESSDFRYFRLSELEAARSLLGQTLELDTAFTAGRLTDVVPAPDL